MDPLAVLPLGFYEGPTLRVARALLGKILVRVRGNVVTAGRIVEVEAYRGPADRAAHSSGGRRTARNEVMWGPAGMLYVYFTYGMHHCANVVTRTKGIPEAVLLRAVEPLHGERTMGRRRGISGAPPWTLARGPANLCRAFAIDRRLNGEPLTGPAIFLLDAPTVAAHRVARTPRIGIAYAGPDASLPWRLLAVGSPAVSGPRTLASPRPPARR